VYKDEQGSTHINMIANNLYIGRKPASTIDYVDNSIKELQLNTKDYVDYNIQETVSTTTGYIDNSISISESNTKTYIDTNIQETATNITEYTNNSITESEVNTKVYVDESVQNAKTELNGYTDDSILASESVLISYMEDRHEELETACNEYTDNKITDFKGYVDEKDLALSNSINLKINKDSVINSINNTPETELIAINKVDVSSLIYNIDNPQEKNYSKNLYSSNGIIYTAPSTTPSTIDDVLDSINISTDNINVSIDISNLENTDYFAASNNNIYMNNNEIIKLLVYEIKKLKEQVNTLMNP
jgi:hypothetical protein